MELSQRKLKLVYLYVALVHYKELRQVVNRKHVPHLQQFHISIRLPGYLNEDFKMIVDDTFDATWPFNNLEYRFEVQVAYWNVNDKRTGRVVLFYICAVHNHFLHDIQTGLIDPISSA